MPDGPQIALDPMCPVACAVNPCIVSVPMGRLGQGPMTAHPVVRLHYRKLHEDYPGTTEASGTLRLVPPLPEYLSYCCCQCGHTQKFKAEELNVIVGNAFQMAYAAQLQRQQTPAFDGLGSQGQIMEIKGKRVGCPAELPPRVTNPSPIDVHISVAGPATSQSVKISHPDSIPGLVDHHQLNVENNLGSPLSISSCQSTPTSDESNSTTELNSYKRLMDKPPLIKKLAMGLASTPNGIPEDIRPLVPHSSTRSDSNSSPPVHRKIIFGGYVNEASAGQEKNNGRIANLSVERLKQSHLDLEMISLAKRLDVDSVSLSRSSQTSSEVNDFKSKRISHISSCSSSLGGPGESSTTTTPPPLPERVDSLAAAASSVAAAMASEEGELRAAPWFQAGIPREITLEVLSHEPIGAFMVRESTSKPGCYALSLRVPRDFQPSGIAHYLIMRTNKGFKIKGFTKEFSTLTALITHHSVMPELLPCPLSLNRYNPTFGKIDTSKDFADIDSDPDYNTLADFRKIMADLNV